jgi:hypothetical protein
VVAEVVRALPQVREQARAPVPEYCQQPAGQDPLAPSDHCEKLISCVCWKAKVSTGQESVQEQKPVLAQGPKLPPASA